jgi:hypothetical protein
MDNLNEILAAIDRHTSQTADVARATLEAAAAQAQVLQEQKKQTKLVETRAAIERGQFLKIGEIANLLAAQQELIQSIHVRLRILEQTSRITMEFIKSTLEAQAKIAPQKARRIGEQIARRSQESLRNELSIHYNNLNTAKEQSAKYGGAIPLDKLNEIKYLEETIAEIEQELDQNEMD